MTVKQLWVVFDDWHTHTEIHLYLDGLHYHICYMNYEQLLYDYGTSTVIHFSYNATENIITIYI